MRRPGLWVANGHPGDPTKMYSWRPGSITCFYDYLRANAVFQYKAANPDVPVIIRFQHPQNWHENPAFSARDLGQQVASKWNDMRVLDPYVYFANEMNLHYENGDQNPANQHLYTTPEFYERYANWVRMTAEVIKNIVPEMKLVTPPFAFGHHEDGSPDDNGVPMDGWAGYDFLANTVRDYFDNIITFHGYWGHGGGSESDWLYDPNLSTWYAFRWQRVLKLFKTRYKMDAKVIIDEAGNFSTSDADFTDQIIYYSEKSLQDERVIALTFFLWLDPTNHPGNMPNSWVQGISNLQEHINRLNSMPDVAIIKGTQPAVTEPTIRVLFEDGTVKVMPIEEYLRAVIPAEVPASWKPEAVKAQAVAARSYAQYAVEHSRHKNADICTTSHCQNYNEAKIHPKSDEAIQATKGIIALYKGKTVQTFYSANCGGQTLNNEDVFKGAPVPYLRGVECPNKGRKRGHRVGFCQYGALSFALRGRTYEQIIKHYFTGVTLGTISVSTPAVTTGEIHGTIFDHTGQPVGGVRTVLTGQGKVYKMSSPSSGAYRFANIPAGSYRIDLPDYQIRKGGINLVAAQSLGIDINLPVPPPQPDITVKITRSAGLSLIVGDWGVPNLPITVTTPFGQVYQLVAGSKPEYGAGGFELYADQTGVYIFEIQGNRFEVAMDKQFTHLTFVKGGKPQPVGVLTGSLQNHLNQPVINRLINLKGTAINLNIRTDGQGRFIFEKLPAKNYTLTVADSEIKQTVNLTNQKTVTLVLKLPSPPPAGGWHVTLERKQGMPLLVGDIGQPNKPIIVTNPFGFQTRVISGSKPEWGKGGFEVYAAEAGNYTVQFLNQTFTIAMGGQFTKATFRQGTAQPEEQARLVSNPMPRSQAEDILRKLEANPDTRNFFNIFKA